MKNLPGQKDAPPPWAGDAARQLIRRAKRATRLKFPAEEKSRIMLEGERAEVSVAELCRREGIHPTMYYQVAEGLHGRQAKHACVATPSFFAEGCALPPAS